MHQLSVSQRVVDALLRNRGTDASLFRGLLVSPAATVLPSESSPSSPSLTTVLAALCTSRGGALSSREVVSLLPSGLVVGGAFLTSSDPKQIANAAEDARQARRVQGGFKGETAVIVAVVEETSCQFYRVLENGDATVISDVQVGRTAEDKFRQDHALFHIRLLTDKFYVPAGSLGLAQLHARVQTFLASLRTSMMQLSFAASSSQQGSLLVASDTQGSLRQAVLDETQRVTGAATPRKGGRAPTHAALPEKLSVRLLRPSTLTSSVPLAPILTCERESDKPLAMFQLPVEAIAYVPWNESPAATQQAVLAAITSALYSSVDDLVMHHGAKASVPYHFKLAQFPFLVRVCYPTASTPFPGESQDHESYKTTRTKYHNALLLPLDRPLLRTNNAFDLQTFRTSVQSDRLLNVHERLGPSGVVGGRLSLVDGPYSYYHYTQDRMDDSGWGCAYRSLQTICSWLRHNGYATRADMTHREIQECLVQVGDKDKSFIGSTQWIGSFELSICLDQCYNITSRIMNLNAGREMADKARELAAHFETQGSPVMIGGGVLAHTILGVDFNAETGDVKYLILDPHYTGIDEPTAVIEKAGCVWKGPDFFVQDAIYNMCLPQRPAMI
ncbi:Ufm1-specific protease 2 [Capsaspora owczarzaki ATCC 30864]|uniref:Ufm1-specific protease 2 n=1 Tax=Capsaspora owczarzaki (strain ATCC 30864) TaxID=595528 RepID=A0A0D2WW28_CAPO3|nr:Ufm1-specific protease 2 [Capsaspora owczarzaki ATCC 30864]KJE97105.1 Ufm1-specific protease 2 [Capsaspora owczarzaki ATCC 30864]|eukprot:XP_004343449.1 Ufm1-specific protease 2 [Capsaspora owczarzaki ATCC 30864]